MESLDFGYYLTLGLKDIDVSEFTPLSIYTAEAVDAYCFRAISRQNLLSDDYYGDIIRKAMAFQIVFMYELGGEAAASGADASAGEEVASESETIGNYSHSKTYASGNGFSSRPAQVGGIRISPIAASLLAPIRAMGRQMCRPLC